MSGLRIKLKKKIKPQEIHATHFRMHFASQILSSTH